MIAFVGSVFSPYYHWAGRREPENHVAFNVALYGPHSNRWSMTERGRGSLWRNADHFAVGRSHMHWDGEALTLDLVERAVPHLGMIRGRIRLRPHQMTGAVETLAPGHHWMTHAPAAHIEVAMTAPALAWEGSGYLDQNWGDEPMEAGFRRWDWLRAEMGRDAAVLYAGDRADGTPFALGRLYRADGGIEPVEVPPARPMRRGFWGAARAIPAEAGAEPRIVATLEDAPFYMRSLIETRIGGRPAHAVHESIDLGRFATRWVKLMLPWRMPRLP